MEEMLFRFLWILKWKSTICLNLVFKFNLSFISSHSSFFFFLISTERYTDFSTISIKNFERIFNEMLLHIFLIRATRIRNFLIDIVIIPYDNTKTSHLRDLHSFPI